MTKRLHTDSKIFFPNPYVVMLEHGINEIDDFQFQKLTRRVYKLIQGTWGFSKPQLEYKLPPPDNKKKPMLSAVPTIFIPTYGGEHTYRSYWAFKDEVDALQFRLMIGEKSLHVFMWPPRFFTIHEVAETDES